MLSHFLYRSRPISCFLRISRGLTFITLVLVLLCCTSCSEHSRKRRPPPIVTGAGRGVERTARVPLPWESWSYGRDNGGFQLSTPTLLRGEDLYTDGIYDRALAAFEEARPVIQQNEQEALEVRIASCLLALDRPTEALEGISRYFAAQGLSEDSVSEPFSLLLAYGYGRKGDLDQSTAWFARVNRNAKSEVGVDRAKRGYKLLLETVPDEELASLAPTWNTDIFISSLIGQERARRTRDGVLARNTIGPFWQVGSWGLKGPSDESTYSQASEDLKRILVLLPLSGRFASLGVSTKQGMMLAFQSTGFDRAVKIDYQDDAGDGIAARERFRAAKQEGRVDLVVGPLVSEAAESVQQLALADEVPMLTFSKRADFRPGDGIYRFGTTNYSQVESLLSLYQSRFYGKKVAFVGPNTPQGQEFRDTLLQLAAARGVQLMSADLYQPGDDVSLLMTAEDLEAAHAEVILFNDEVAPSARIIGNISPEARKRIAVIGTALWDSPRELSNSRAVMEGVYFTSFFFQNDPRELTKNFNVAYKSQFGKNADFLAAQGFDAATMITAAFQREMSEGVKIAEALGEVDRYDGLTGSLRSSTDGEISREMQAVRYLGGAIKSVDSVEIKKGGL